MSILDRFKKPKKKDPTPDTPAPLGPGVEESSDVCVEGFLTKETVETLLERSRQATPVSEIAGEGEEE